MGPFFILSGPKGCNLNGVWGLGGEELNWRNVQNISPIVGEMALQIKERISNVSIPPYAPRINNVHLWEGCVCVKEKDP